MLIVFPGVFGPKSMIRQRFAVRRLFVLLLGMCALWLATPRAATAQAVSGDFLPPTEAFRVEAYPEGSDRLRVEFLVTSGYYLYRSRLNFTTPQAGVTFGPPQMRAGEIKEDEFFGKQEVYHESFTVTLPVSRPPGGDLVLPLVVGLQGCADAGLCYPPEKRRMNVNLPAGGASVATGAGGGFVSEQDRLATLIKNGSLPLVLATFFGLGLLLAFTPCVLPMVPILSGIIAGQGAEVTTRRAFGLSLTYVLGMAFMNTLAGIAAAAAGAQVQAAFQKPWIIIAFAALFVILAISMFGAFTIQLPSSLQTKLSDVSNRQRAGTYGGVAVMGALSALIVSACVAPPLFAALAVIGQTGDVIRGGSALFAMSIGMGVPLLVIGTSAGRLLPRAGGWMDVVKKFFGVLMLGVAVWMLARLVGDRVALALWAVPAAIAAVLLWRELRPAGLKIFVTRGLAVLAGLWALALLAGAALGGHDPLRPIPQWSGAEHGVTFRRIKTVAELDRVVAESAAAGKPAMLDFYADWCISCKEMERDTFTDPAVRAALANVTLLQADVTANDADDQALLQRFGIFGPPTIAFYGPDGTERARYRVVGFMPAKEFSNVVAQATTR